MSLFQWSNTASYDSSISILQSELGYSTEEFKDLPRIAIVLFGTVG